MTTDAERGEIALRVGRIEGELIIPIDGRVNPEAQARLLEFFTEDPACPPTHRSDMTTPTTTRTDDLGMIEAANELDFREICDCQDLEKLRLLAAAVSGRVHALASRVGSLATERDEARQGYADAHADRLARTLERDRTVDEREYLKGEVARLTAELANARASRCPS